MRSFKSNKYFVIASLSTFVYLGVGHFVKLPNIVEGFCVGLSNAFYLVGLFDLSRFQSFKKNLIERLAK